MRLADTLRFARDAADAPGALVGPGDDGAALRLRSAHGPGRRGERRAAPVHPDLGPHRLPDDAARTGDDGEQLARQAGLVEQFGRGERAVRGLAVGLDHDRVAGEERGAWMARHWLDCGYTAIEGEAITAETVRKHVN